MVNTCRWHKDSKGKWKSGYNFPEDGKVNNEDAVQWVSHFCEKYGYKIVISSTWRQDGFEICVDCLRNAGLRDTVEVIGATPNLDKERGHEIKAWLDEHPEVTGYIIFDDDSDMVFPDFFSRLVKCALGAGFTVDQFIVAEMIHKAFNNNCE